MCGHADPRQAPDELVRQLKPTHGVVKHFVHDAPIEAGRPSKRLSLKGLSGSWEREKPMIIRVGYGLLAAAPTLALVGLVFLVGPLHVRNLMNSIPAHANEAAPAADGGDKVKPRADVAANDGVRSVGNVCDWEALDWDELSRAERQAWQILGLSRANWSSDTVGASSWKDWSELTRKEKNAAQALGYSEQNWEADCPLSLVNPTRNDPR
jgi:hypothetical protein